MEIMDTTSIIEAKLFFKIRGQILIAQSRDDSGQKTNGQSCSRIVQYSRSSANNYSTAQSCIEQMLHGKFVFEKGTRHKGGKTTSSQGQNCVRYNLSLSKGSRSQYSKVKGRPVHPQEECPYEGEDIRCVIGLGFGRWFDYSGQDEAEEKSSVCSKSMNDHRSSHIKGVDYLKTDNFVQSVSDLVNQTDNSHLKRTDSSNCRSNVDVHAGC